MTKLFYGLLAGALLTTQTAVAEEGLYYGISAAWVDTTSEAEISLGITTHSEDISLGGVVGYGYALSNGRTIAIEGTLEFSSAQTFSYSGGFDACTSFSPDWCEVETIARVRGVYSTPSSIGYDIVSMAGIAAVMGRAEDGPGVYVDTTAIGYTLGLGLETEALNGTVRYEFTYDNFDDHSPEVYDKTLEILSLRMSYFF